MGQKRVWVMDSGSPFTLDLLHVKVVIKAGEVEPAAFRTLLEWLLEAQGSPVLTHHQ